MRLKAFLFVEQGHDILTKYLTSQSAIRIVVERGNGTTIFDSNGWKRMNLMRNQRPKFGGQTRGFYVSWVCTFKQRFDFRRAAVHLDKLPRGGRLVSWCRMRDEVNLIWVLGLWKIRCGRRKESQFEKSKRNRKKGKMPKKWNENIEKQFRLSQIHWSHFS